DLFLEAKAKTDKEIEEPKREVLNSKKQQQELIESSVFDIEDPMPKNNNLISEILIDKLRPSTVKNNNRNTKEIDKRKVVQLMSYNKAIKCTTKDKHMFILLDWKCKIIKKRI
ncbi:33291_t:CDS:2, partial [Gigaspora margarita]